ncbi:ParB/RepB/Spo0J family partition protein [Mobilitalea sibirica]|uniref:ParB/RepB/Spo0J family partition protein n=1 Tax=Mobilitalea sibirica TaxID=1462919 RepID=A0A8J7HC09_9FIRM|nr:ParB/RepB/Spo0J family partition protein [Mobilitalea sibirica]MBH1941960.1 ParB/RepB/Spo0J family partition protein [Mobilitalea sibirica]
MAVKKGLGKGLDIMIPERIQDNNEIQSENVSRETMIHISDIEPNKTQPRKKFDEDALHELADSIKQYGIIQPLILQKRDKYYEIIAGERRWRAARMAGLKEVPAIIKDYSPQEIVEIALIENIQREDLNPIEEAFTYQRLIQEFHLKQDELAERVSKSRAAVTNSLRLLKLDGRVQQMLIDDILSSGHARALLPIEDKDKQYYTACKIFDEKLSVRDTEKLVKQILKEKPHKEIATTLEDSFIYKDLEEKFRNIIGTKVSIHRKQKNRGKIEIEYYSKEELERIIELFEALS